MAPDLVLYLVGVEEHQPPAKGNPRPSPVKKGASGTLRSTGAPGPPLGRTSAMPAVEGRGGPRRGAAAARQRSAPPAVLGQSSFRIFSQTVRALVLVLIRHSDSNIKGLLPEHLNPEPLLSLLVQVEDSSDGPPPCLRLEDLHPIAREGNPNNTLLQLSACQRSPSPSEPTRQNAKNVRNHIPSGGGKKKYIYIYIYIKMKESPSRASRHPAAAKSTTPKVRICQIPHQALGRTRVALERSRLMWKIVEA